MTRDAHAEANHQVALAVKAGGLLPAKGQPCKVCAKPARFLHHWSYLPAHALDVAPLCGSCHQLVHCGRIPDPTSGQTWEPDRVIRRTLTKLELEQRELYGNALRAARIKKGLTQNQAGRASGMTGSAWSMIENGRRGVSEAVLHRMAVALGLRLTLSVTP